MQSCANEFTRKPEALQVKSRGRQVNKGSVEELSSFVASSFSERRSTANVERERWRSGAAKLDLSELPVNPMRPKSCLFEYSFRQCFNEVSKVYSEQSLQDKNPVSKSLMPLMSSSVSI